MSLFFFLSAVFVPGSYDRRAPAASWSAVCCASACHSWWVR
ncbi:hypothetical protein [Streptomyces sp. P3]|nr:hypothetical protein [Streptomyces sp. P3]